MYIEPNTIIRIINNCPLDPSYDHTIFFYTRADQTTYFQSITKYTLQRQSYQRVQRGVMRVNYKAEDLYDCNYLAFQNTAFGNKWFYAFITAVEYVNNVTSEIAFQIDVMQTWHFDYQPEMCFVDREHSSTDEIGDNLVPENLELGDYVSDDFSGTSLLADKSIVVAATFDENYDNVSGTIYSGIFSGLYFTVFPNTSQGAQDCAAFIQGAGAKTDGIVSVFLMPTVFVTNVLEPVKTYSISKSKLVSGSIDGYTPRNKKLYTFPYNFLYVTNLQGNAASFPYEYFTGNACEFTLVGDMSPNPSVVLFPNNYKGVTANYDEKLTLTGYPQLSFNTDTFKAWLAQNATNLAVSAISGGAGGALDAGRANASLANATTPMAASAANLGLTGAALGIGINVASICAQIYSHSILPHQAHSGVGSTTACAIGIQDFAFMHKHIRGEFANIIDNYFTMFGYATHRVKYPNRTARPEWNYVRTVGFTLTGSIPGDDAIEICNIYNKGITFWKNPAHIGDYNYDNRPPHS